MVMGKTSLVASRNSNLLAKYDVLEDILQNSFLNPILMVNKIPIIAQIWQEEGPIIKKYYPLMTMKPLKSLAWSYSLFILKPAYTKNRWFLSCTMTIQLRVIGLETEVLKLLSVCCFVSALNRGRQKKWSASQRMTLAQQFGIHCAIELWVVDKSCHTPNSPSSFFIQLHQNILMFIRTAYYQNADISNYLRVVSKGGGLRVAWNLIKDVPSSVGTAALQKN